MNVLIGKWTIEEDSQWSLKDSTQKINDILAKGEDMTVSEFRLLLSKEVELTEIRKALGWSQRRIMDLWEFTNGKTKRGRYNKKGNKEALQLVKEGKLSVDEIAKKTGAKRETIINYRSQLRKGKISI